MTAEKKIAPVSIVFPYHNEAPTIHKTIELICNQNVLPREVIFVNSSSPDNCSDVIDKWITENQSKQPIIFKNIFKGTNTPASSKNAGIDEATSEYVGFMDCGLLFPANWIETHFEIIDKEAAKFVSGQCLFLGESLMDSCAMAQTYGYKRARPTVPSTIIHREIIAKGGKFLENRRAGYDAIWPQTIIEMGYKRHINTNVTLRYNGINFAPSLLAILKKSKLYAIPTVALPHYNVPYYYVALLILGLILVSFKPVVFFILLAGYILLRGFAIPILKSRSLIIFKDYPLAVIYLPLMGFVMDTGRMLGILQGVYRYHIQRSNLVL